MQCQWSAADMQVFTTPLVVDLDLDGKPEIVFHAIPCRSWGCDTREVRLVAVRGHDCTEVFSRPAGIWFASQLAVGDLSGDSRPEIVAVDQDVLGQTDPVVRVFGSDGALIASSGPLPDLLSRGAAPREGPEGSGPALANLDGTGSPEIIVGGTVLRLVPGPPPRIELVWSRAVPGGSVGWLSLVADVDLDGKPEVVAGNRILAGATGADATPAGLSALPPGYPAVAEMDRTTPEPEIVLTSSTGMVSTITFVHPGSGAAVFGPYSLNVDGPYLAGAPAVADFDGDGEAEVGVATTFTYRVYDRECAASPLPAKCEGPGLLWSSPTQDHTSGSTTSTVFDFNADCRSEVVYRDECWLRIYDGATGTVRSAFAVTSGTVLEGPVIADVDGDGSAEIVVSSDAHRGCPGVPEATTGAPFTGPSSGVVVIGDPDRRWAPARRIWNQATYHVTNVNEDGTIPLVEKNSWDVHNVYRANVRP